MKAQKWKLKTISFEIMLLDFIRLANSAQTGIWLPCSSDLTQLSFFDMYTKDVVYIPPLPTTLPEVTGRYCLATLHLLCLQTCGQNLNTEMWQATLSQLFNVDHKKLHHMTYQIYRISRPARHTFFPEKCDLNLTCVLCTEGKYYFQTYKYLYIYYTTFLSWDNEICFQLMRSGITACERLTFLSGDLP